MKNIIVVDLDGTLADISHRVALVKKVKPDWDKFYSLVSGDRVNGWCADLMDAMYRQGYQVFVVSARPSRCLEDIEKWLRDNGVQYSRLYLLRGAEGDYRPDVELKRAWLAGQDKEAVAFVVDDRQRVVDMWREEGITCLQCAKWEEYRRPK